MPVHAFVDDRYLVEKGLRNYWGYNTIGFFAPEPRYFVDAATCARVQDDGEDASLGRHRGDPRRRLQPHRRRQPARADAVASAASTTRYYRLKPENPRYYIDYTGCGNTLNMQHPRVLQLIMDSLRYWVTEMHVDGFRFDLASALARELHDVDRLGAFFDIIRQDPVLSQVKLIAEPWDLGEGGYQVGNFPAGWAEWNDKYRDTVRAYWKGDGGVIGEFARGSPARAISTSAAAAARMRASTSSPRTTASRCTISSATTKSTTRPTAKTTATAQRQPLVELRRRRADRRPGDQRAARAAEAQLARDADAVAGRADDARRATRSAARQGGNNNAYCQDNEISWFDWKLDGRRSEQLARVLRTRMIALRRGHPVFRRRHFFQGRRARQRVEGHRLAQAGRRGDDREEWSEATSRAAWACISPARRLREIDDRGRPMRDDKLPPAVQRAPRGDPVRAAGVRAAIALAGRASTRRYDDGLVRGGRSIEPGNAIRCRAARSRCCSRRRSPHEAAPRRCRSERELDGRRRVAFACGRRARRRVELDAGTRAERSRSSPMPRDADGWFELVATGAAPGTRYRYRIDGELRVPDPASRYNPDDVHGASEVVDPRAFDWHDATGAVGRGTKP